MDFETQLSDFLCIRRRNMTSVGRSVLRLEEDGRDGVETLPRLVGRLLWLDNMAVPCNVGPSMDVYAS